MSLGDDSIFGTKKVYPRVGGGTSISVQEDGLLYVRVYPRVGGGT